MRRKKLPQLLICIFHQLRELRRSGGLSVISDNTMKLSRYILNGLPFERMVNLTCKNHTGRATSAPNSNLQRCTIRQNDARSRTSARRNSVFNKLPGEHNIGIHGHLLIRYEILQCEFPLLSSNM